MPPHNVAVISAGFDFDVPACVPIWTPIRQWKHPVLRVPPVVSTCLHARTWLSIEGF